MLWQAFPNMFSEAVDKTTNETLEFDQTPFENPNGDKYTPAED